MHKHGFEMSFIKGSRNRIMYKAPFSYEIKGEYAHTITCILPLQAHSLAFGTAILSRKKAVGGQIFQPSYIFKQKLPFQLSACGFHYRLQRKEYQRTYI